MKKLIVLLALLLFVSPAFGATWCMWSGTEGEYCQSDSRGYVRMPNGHPISALPEDLAYYGFFELVTTQPVLGENQVRDTEVWGFADNKITKTWTVRDMTVSEIDTRTAGPMPLSEYHLWKALIVTGVITQQQAVQNLPQELIDAYLARDRLENPE